MKKIDFRNEHTIVSVISFMVSLICYRNLPKLGLNISASMGSALPFEFLFSLGLYVFLFRSLMLFYNKILWKCLGYRDINISGYWHYRSYKSTTQTQTEGYAFIMQDMYDIDIYGFNIGSSGDNKALSMWKTNNVIISRGALYYDYELFAERPGRICRIIKSRVSLNLFGTPPTAMVGIYLDLPIASKDDKIQGNLAGSIIFSRCEYNSLSNAAKELFDNMKNPQNTA